MLKNAIFNDLFLTSESKNINNIKTAKMKLHNSEMYQLKMFAKRELFFANPNDSGIVSLSSNFNSCSERFCEGISKHQP